MPEAGGTCKYRDLGALPVLLSPPPPRERLRSGCAILTGLRTNAPVIPAEAGIQVLIKLGLWPLPLLLLPLWERVGARVPDSLGLK
jgi:hypothetical protein